MSLLAFDTLISINDLYRYYNHPDWVVVDCRFSLPEPALGYRQYLEAHIPGAVYAHLDDDLSGPIHKGKTGRHPLPNVDQMAVRFSTWGIDPATQVVAYDDTGGAIAARLWFLLRWLGHPSVAVLDGGWRHWINSGHPSKAGKEARKPKSFIPQLQPAMVASTQEVLDHLEDPTWWIIDSRAPERYRGELEPIDPVAGRIPGALNVPHADTVDPEFRFISRQAIQDQFGKMIQHVPTENLVFYCGSGVTAARNLLALAHAGVQDARLYAGSWSEWITDPSRPVERG